MAHFSVASLTQIVLLLVFICWTPSSTGAAFSLEEEFLQLKENYIQMKQLFESTTIELQAKNVQLEVKIGKLEAKVEQQDSLLTSILREKNERTAAAATDYVPIGNNQSAVFINGMPSSCGDLRLIGHTLNGFYFVMGYAAKIESVFCDFSQTPENFQKFIGYADVKSALVHFYVQRSTSFSSSGPIPYNLALVNEGNAMDLASGIFTAPRPGIYFFSFAGTASLEYSSWVVFASDLYLNGNLIGSTWVQENRAPVYQYSPVTVQSTLNLKKGDQVWVQINYGNGDSYLCDADFTGFMLEEEIGASL